MATNDTKLVESKQADSAESPLESESSKPAENKPIVLTLRGKIGLFNQPAELTDTFNAAEVLKSREAWRVMFGKFVNPLDIEITASQPTLPAESIPVKAFLPADSAGFFGHAQEWLLSDTKGATQKIARAKMNVSTLETKLTKLRQQRIEAEKKASDSTHTISAGFAKQIDSLSALINKAKKDSLDEIPTDQSELDSFGALRAVILAVYPELKATHAITSPNSGKLATIKATLQSLDSEFNEAIEKQDWDRVKAIRAEMAKLYAIESKPADSADSKPADSADSKPASQPESKPAG